VLVFGGADEIDREVSDDGHVFCAVALAQTGLVVLEELASRADHVISLAN
jgi:hypothetical protein